MKKGTANAQSRVAHTKKAVGNIPRQRNTQVRPTVSSRSASVRKGRVQPARASSQSGNDISDSLIAERRSLASPVSRADGFYIKGNEPHKPVSWRHDTVFLIGIVIILLLMGYAAGRGA